jgi:hypothetical protein
MKNTFFFCFLLLLFPFGAYAQMTITEIMYDPEGTDADAGGEWIEVYAESNVDNVISWKVADRTGESGSFANRTITHASGAETIGAGVYAVFAKDPTAFTAIFPSYDGPLFKSTFSLTDDDVIKLLNENLSEKDNVSYTADIGGKGDGNTIQKDGDVWTNGTPTPGEEFAGGTKDSNQDKEEEEKETVGSTSGGTSSHSGPSPLSNTNSTKPLSLYIGEGRLTSVGSPLQFIAEVKNLTDAKRKPEFVWSMGDGRTREGEEIEYSYDRAGIYVIVVNAYEKERQGTARISVRVNESDLHITGTAEGDIVIENKHEGEINLYNFRIETEDGSFRFPLDTILLRDSTLTLSPDTTNIVVQAETSILLRNPDGAVVSESVREIVSSSIILSEIIPASFFTRTSAWTQSAPISEVSTPSISPSLPTLPATETFIEDEEEKISEVAGVTFAVEKPKSMWQRMGEFFKGIFD